MRPSFRPSVCRNCGRTRDPSELDASLWCRACRKAVVRRSALWARVSALIVALGLGAWIALTMRPTRFLAAWMAIIAFAYLIVSKIVQRVAFEIIRARGVPGTDDDHG